MFAAVGEGYVDVPGGRVWWRSMGDEHANIPLLCLHGGPGFAHDYLDCFEDLAAGRRVIFYDQLGCGRSAGPTDESLWTVERFVEELVAVREALNLDRLHLLGSSWGGMLAMEYVIRKQPQLDSLILAGSPASIPEWERYAKELLGAFPRDLQDTVRRHEENGWYSCPEYQAAIHTYYRRHLFRTGPFPAGLERSFAAVNADIYMYMQGPSEFTIIGTLKDWDILDQLGDISVPTLLTVGRHDECPPHHVEEMQRRIPNSRHVVFEEGSHLHFYEQRADYMATLEDWFADVEGHY